MTLAILAEPAPLTINPDGVVKVGGTRVTLDTVIFVFKQGATAEEIVYPILRTVFDCQRQNAGFRPLPQQVGQREIKGFSSCPEKCPDYCYRYPSLKLGDVYASIAFYLNHQEDVEAYLKQRQQQAQEIRQMNEARFDPQGLRDRLLARRVEQQG